MIQYVQILNQHFQKHGDRMVVKRITKPQVAKSIKYLAGTKEKSGMGFETNPETYNTEGTLISINPEKIDSNGWRVKIDDYKTFDCTYTSDVRIMPEYIVRNSGEWIPKSIVTAQVSVDTIMQTYNILQITVGEQIPVELEPGTTNVIHDEKVSVSMSEEGVSLNGESFMLNGESVENMVSDAIEQFEEDNDL